MAKAHCSEAYVQAAGRCLQIHGGIGFTWDNPTHLYLKRAKSSLLLLGDPVYHRDRLARALGA
jgi:alkylation response protein AidB-like acyl-CoA dehydrogenase